MEKNELIVFLASPGDLPKERNIVEEAALRFNKILGRRINWSIDLLVWEDTPPGYSRPQSIINKYVDSCDLFIGLLWKKWGQPTGEYTSGFYEEFIRATNRHEKSGKPEIWLYFKAIDEDDLKDPGDQLKKVIKFKEEQIRRKKLKFKEFKNSDKWNNKIYDDLQGYVYDLSEKKSEYETQKQSFTLELPGTNFWNYNVVYTSDSNKIIPQELVSLYNKAIGYLNNPSSDTIDLIDKSRLFLQSSAWFSEVHYGEIFGIHESNLIYLQRKEWSLSNDEKWFLFRSLIGDLNDLRPCWYWLQNWEEEYIDKTISRLAVIDLNVDVRRMAFSILTDTNYDADFETLRKGLNDKNDDVVLQAIRLLRKTEKIEFIELLNDLINSSEGNKRDAAITARLEILFINDQNKAFSELITFGVKIPKLFKDKINNLELNIDKELLLKALECSETSVRLYSAQYLRLSKLITKDVCHLLLKDSDSYVRKEGVLGLIDLGVTIDIDMLKNLFPEKKESNKIAYGLLHRPQVKADDFIPLIFKKREPEELLNSLDFYNLNGDVAYRILAVDHFELIKNRIRADLDQEFETLRLESEKRFEENFGSGSKILLGEWKPKLIDFIKNQFISSALDGLSKNGKEEDVKYARIFLKKSSLNSLESIKLIDKFGDSSDVENLLEVAADSYGDTQKLAVKTALKLTDNICNLLIRLLNSDDTSILEIAIETLATIDITNKLKLAKTLLHSERDHIRLKGLAIIYKCLEHDEIEKTLDEYISKKSYYYNVVNWLDKCLYAPEKYRNFYESELLNRLSI